MNLTPTTLQGLFQTYSKHFQQGFESLGSDGALYEQFCTSVPSTGAAEIYPFLKGLPRLREWIGERVVHSLDGAEFSIKNRKFELTEGISRDVIEDDAHGLYTPVFEEFGRSSREHPNELAAEILDSNPKCYDGASLFGSHVVLNDKGQEALVSNDIGGNGAAWYVMDLTRVIKPLIFQKRRDYKFRAMTDLNSERVFMADKFLLGVDARVNAGPGLWQLAVRCKEPFSSETYEAARKRLQELKGDHGRPLGLRHSHTMVPNNFEGAALRVLNNAQAANGSTNEWAGTSKLILNPWLVGAA